MRRGKTFGALRRAYCCDSRETARRHLRAWYGLPLGRRLQKVEHRQLEAILPNLFGYHLLQMGNPVQEHWLGESPISHRIIMDELPGSTGAGADLQRSLVADPCAVPIGSGCVDVVILPHVLEFEEHPHQVLREAERVLIPEGHVVILGFNPFSTWGLRRLVSGWCQEAPWCGRFYSLTRIKDWLALLGFDTVLTRYYFFRPPLQNDGIMERLGFLERLGRRWWPVLGGGYVLVAKKRVTTLTPIRPRWRSVKRWVPGGVPGSTLRYTDEE
jgi:SAM-dependent methyltransferase